MDRVTLLGVDIDPLTMDGAIERISALLDDDGHHHVMTPNSEMLVAASRDPEFRAILRTTTLNIADSVGLVWMARRTGQHLPERVAGVDVVTRLAGTLRSNQGVFLLGAAPGVAEAAAKRLMEAHPTLRIVGTVSGSPRAEDAGLIIAAINATQPALLLVAFGAPAQDLWIHKHLHELPSVRVAMGVGGTFDFLAGVQKRAPAFMRRLGLEWLWRVLREPRRIGRIWTAVVTFPCLVFAYGKHSPLDPVR